MCSDRLNRCFYWLLSDACFTILELILNACNENVVWQEFFVIFTIVLDCLCNCGNVYYQVKLIHLFVFVNKINKPFNKIVMNANASRIKDNK